MGSTLSLNQALSELIDQSSRGWVGTKVGTSSRSPSLARASSSGSRGGYAATRKRIASPSRRRLRPSR